MNEPQTCYQHGSAALTTPRYKEQGMAASHSDGAIYSPQVNISYKTCKVCGESKPVSQFSLSRDKHLCRACKSCRAAAAKADRAATPEKYRQAQARFIAKHGQRKRSPESIRKRRLAFKAKHPDRFKAHRAVYTAKKSGRLIPATKCEHCGASVSLQGHHADYSKPLEVEWLCRKCHTLADSKRRNVNQ